MGRAELHALVWLYKKMDAEYAPADRHEQLLFEHMATLKNRLEKMYEKPQKKYTLSFTSVDAMAFTQFWNIEGFKIDTYSALSVGRLIQTIDKSKTDFFSYGNIEG